MVEEYKCNKCNKNYSSYKSLWKHNKNFHTNNNTQNNIVPPQITIKECVKLSTFICKKCNKSLSRSDSLKRHENKCTKVNEDKLKIELLLKEKEERQIEILKLKLKLENSKRLDNKTFKAVNKILKDRASIVNSQNNNINSNNTTNIQNNIKIVGFGKEEVYELLSLQDKKQIINSRYLCLEKLVEIAHYGKYDQFKNIIITNLKDNFAYKFDEKLGYFVVTTKNDIFNDLISNRLIDIEAIYDELSEINKIDEKTKVIIQNFLDKIQNEDQQFIDENENTTFTNYKTYKINKIKILLYNNQDKITKDIALLISN
jgi:hypothetical protein